MSDVACQRALRKLISDYSEYLTHGFVHQGQQRRIVTIALSPMTAPTGYYHILIEVDQVLRRAAASINTSTMGDSEYNVLVHIVDLALAANYGEEPYELMHSDFRNLGNRLVALFTSSYDASMGSYCEIFQSAPRCITDPVTGAKFHLARNLDIAKYNEDDTWADPDTNRIVPLFYSRINLKVLGGSW